MTKKMATKKVVPGRGADAPSLPLKRAKLEKVGEFPSKYDQVPRPVYKHPDNVCRLVKTPSDRLEVTITMQIKGRIRRADLDRFTQTMGKTAAFEFEDGGNGM